MTGFSMPPLQLSEGVSTPRHAPPEGAGSNTGFFAQLERLIFAPDPVKAPAPPKVAPRSSTSAKGDWHAYSTPPASSASPSCEKPKLLVAVPPDVRRTAPPGTQTRRCCSGLQSPCCTKT